MLKSYDLPMSESLGPICQNPTMLSESLGYVARIQPCTSEHFTLRDVEGLKTNDSVNLMLSKHLGYCARIPQSESLGYVARIRRGREG